jgi:hypothetical protein
MFAWIATRTGVQLPSPPIYLFSVAYTPDNAEIGTIIGTHPQESNDVRYDCDTASAIYDLVLQTTIAADTPSFSAVRGRLGADAVARRGGGKG